MGYPYFLETPILALQNGVAGCAGCHLQRGFVQFYGRLADIVVAKKALLGTSFGAFFFWTYIARARGQDMNLKMMERETVHDVYLFI